jgi:uncharacterized protein (TIGR00251 family)
VKGKPNRPPARDADSQAVVSVRIQPRASRNGMTITEDGALKIRLTAPPVDGAANEALIKFLAEALSISRSRVEIVAGQTSRQKVVRIAGISIENVQRLLNAVDK